MYWLGLLYPLLCSLDYLKNKGEKYCVSILVSFLHAHILKHNVLIEYCINIFVPVLKNKDFLLTYFNLSLLSRTASSKHVDYKSNMLFLQALNLHIK